MRINEVRRLNHMILKTIELINLYEMHSHEIPGQQFDKVMVDHTRNLSAPFEKWIDKKIEAEESLKRLEIKLNIKSKELSKLFDKRISNVDIREVLKLRYIECLEFNEIALRVYSSEATVYRLHRRGKEMFESFEKVDSCDS